jgi:hypothetical protein
MGSSSTVNENDNNKLKSRYNFLPEDKATTPPTSGYFQALSNRWWVSHPEKGLAFFWMRGDKGLGSPQCNINESISIKIGVNSIEGAQVKFIPVVYVPIDLRDYA